jgi:threonine synthase
LRYLSTRSAENTDLVDAIMRGLAADGGLFVPEELPRVEPATIQGETLAAIASEILAPFFAGSSLAYELPRICRDALSFPVPLVPLIEPGGALSVLELFHGPTAAFKDVGARFLAAVMERALHDAASADSRPLTILVATSGDTGAAVAAAFDGRAGIRVGVLFPRGQVSPRQQHQLTCWGPNIRTFEVRGTFDDCQALVKAAFNDPDLRARHRLTAANSINIGRLLPQVAYHAAASLWHWRRHGTPVSMIVPTGNLGNGVACVWARALGMPIREIIFAVNANRTIPDYLATGQWQPRTTRQTLASAMDVGNPSNMERLFNLVPDFGALRESVEAYPVDDESIRLQIGKDYERFGRVWCPHTATGFWVYDQLPPSRTTERAWIVDATAHPAKFDTIVEPVIGTAVPVPPALQDLLMRPVSSIALEPALTDLARELNDWQ